MLLEPNCTQVKRWITVLNDGCDVALSSSSLLNLGTPDVLSCINFHTNETCSSAFKRLSKIIISVVAFAGKWQTTERRSGCRNTAFLMDPGKLALPCRGTSSRPKKTSKFEKTYPYNTNCLLYIAREKHWGSRLLYIYISPDWSWTSAVLFFLCLKWHENEVLRYQDFSWSEYGKCFFFFRLEMPEFGCWLSLARKGGGQSWVSPSHKWKLKTLLRAFVT